MRNMKKILSFLLVLSMVLSYVPMPALAEEVTCTHHVHDESCGFVEGVSCGHVHGEGCGDVTVTNCAHVHGTEGCTFVAGTPAVSCHPDHNEDCGYVAGAACECDLSEGKEHQENCGYVAAVSCNVTHDGCGCVAEVPASGECNHGECTAESGCVKTTFVCAHTVCDESCGFVQSQPCNYDPTTCAECAAVEEEPALLTITAWSWGDDYEIISADGTYATLPNAADWETLKSVLPAYITAMVDGAEVEIPVQWECETFPTEGEGQGTYELKATLPEGYALDENTAALILAVDLGVAEDLDIVDSGTCGTNVNWTLDSDGLLTISGSGKMTSSPWRDSYKSKIKEVSIEDSVTNICANAFNGCSSLTTITVEGDLTEVGGSAFQNCSGLKSATFKGDVGTVGYMAFNSSTSTLNLTIHGNATSFEQNVFNFSNTALTLNYYGTIPPNKDNNIYSGWGKTYTINVTPAYYAQSSYFCDLSTVRPVLNITVNSDGDGTAVAKYNGNPVTSLGMKRVATLVAYPNDGYYLKEYQVVSGGITIDESNSFTVGQEDIVIKAIFEAIPGASYTVSFNANGGTGNMDMITVENGKTETLPKNLFVRNNYSFKGWTTAPDGTGTSYADEAEISITETTTLYAQWEKITYSVTYEANGGAETMDMLTVEAADENNYTFPECGFTAPDGKVFAGWTYRTDTDANTNTYIPGNSIRISEDITVTAQWAEPAAEVTIGGETTQYGSFELAVSAVEGKTAEIKLLNDVNLTKRLILKANNLSLDLNSHSINKYYLTLCNTVSITGPGTLGDSMWLDIEQNAVVTINKGVAITKNDTAVAIQMKDGSKLILNGGSITLSNTTSGQIGGQSSSTVVVNADGVANRFDRQNVYYNISPAVEPTVNPILSGGKIWYKIDNQIAGTTLEGTVTYDGNTYAAEGATVTVSKDDLAACYCNDVAATKNQDGTFTFTMPAAVATITDEPNHNHVWEYNADGVTITATCTSTVGTCPNPSQTVTLSAPLLTIYGGKERANATLSADTVGVLSNLSSLIQYQKKDGESWSDATTTPPTDAGTYKASLTVDTDKTISVEYTIAKRSITITANDQTITYGDNLSEYAVTISDGYLVSEHILVNVTLTPSTINATTNGKITPSNAVITYRDKDVTTNYEFTYVNGALIINKANTSISINGYAPSKTYDGVALANPTADQLTITGASYNDVTFTWYQENGDEDIKLDSAPKDAGTYYVVASIAETANTKESSATSSTVNISKASVEAKDTELTITNNLAKTYTVDLAALLPALETGKSYGDVSYTIKTYDLQGYNSVAPSITNGVLSLPVQSYSSFEEGEFGSIIISFTSDNYTISNATITVKRTNKAAATITGVTAASGLTYTGNAQVGYTGTPAVQGYTGTFDVIYTGTGNTTYGPSTTAPTNAGTYSVKIAIPETHETLAGETTLNFTIAKATVTITAEDKTAVEGDAKPALTYTVTGLKGNDKLTTAPTLTCNADMSKPGDYAITPSNAQAGDNYNITYVAGKLTVYKKHDVKIASVTNGTVSVSPEKAAYGTQVAITVTPKSGYKLSTLTVKDAAGKSYVVSTDNNGKYYFTMPDADVTVKATFSKISTATADPTNPKTGDDFQLVLWSSILCGSVLSMAVLLTDNKKRIH